MPIYFHFIISRVADPLQGFSPVTVFPLATLLAALLDRLVWARLQRFAILLANFKKGLDKSERDC
jgi:hypothetical protein